MDINFLNGIICRYKYILMNFIAKITRSPLLNYVRASFSNDGWKDRDQSAEKVYISQEESNLYFYSEKALSALLHKIADN